MKSGTFAAIDVGTTKVCTIVGEVAGTGETRILGVGVSPSAGLSRGMVDNIREATEAIRASVEKAERASGTRILSAHVGLSGAHVQSVNNRGIVAVPDRSRPISARRHRPRPRRREDHQHPDQPRDPPRPAALLRRRWPGQRQRPARHVRPAPRRRSAHHHGRQQRRRQRDARSSKRRACRSTSSSCSPWPAPRPSSTPEEKRQGVILADIGGGCTDIAVFVEGSIHHTATLPVGGNHITRDLVVGLRCPYHSAEEAKETLRPRPAQRRRRRRR